jgi:hypothetical protein
MENYIMPGLNSTLGMFLLFGLGITLTVVGYLLKGVWGACIALGCGVVLFLYFNGLLHF